MSWAHRYLVLGGLMTHYLEAGDGPALVLMHGGEYGAGAEVTWTGCIDALARHYRVIAPDFYGYGYSDKVRDMRGQRRRNFDQIRDLLAALAIDSAHFVGTSMSGRMVLEAAVRNPRPWPMAALVAVGVGLFPPSGPDQDKLTAYDGTRDGLRELLPVLFANPRYTEDEEYLDFRYRYCAIPGAWEFGAASRLRSPARGAGPAAPGGRPSQPPSYHGIALPACFVVGEHDRLVPREPWQELCDQVSGAERHVIAEAGHYPQIEQAGQFSQLVLDFLRERAT